MDAGEEILMLLVFVPAMASMLTLVSKDRKVLKTVVLASSLACAALSLGLLLFIIGEDASEIALSRSDMVGADLALIVLDVLLAIVIAFIGYSRKNAPIVILSVSTLAITLLIEAFAKEEAVGPAFTADYLAIVMLLITNVIGGIICIYAIGYMADDRRQRRFFAFMLLFISAMSGAVLSNDLTWLFFFWEVTTLCSYMLIAHERTPEAYVSAERALKYTLVGALGFSLAMVLLVDDFPTLELSEMSPGLMGDMAIVSLPLLAMAAMAKSAQLPFQSWLVGAMVAPTPVSALLHSATMVNLGAYLMLRLWHYWSFYDYLGWGLVALGGLTFLATSVFAIRQSSSKRVLAYSTIANLGLIFMCAGLATEVSVAAGILLLLFHAMAKGLLFLAVGSVKHVTGSEDIEDMHELRRWMPVSAFAIYAGTFLILLPPFGLFIAKWMLSEAVTDLPWAAFLMAGGFGATTVYYGKWLGRMYMASAGATRTPLRGAKISGYFKWTMLSLIAGGVLLSAALSAVLSGLVDPFVPSGVDVDIWGNLSTQTGSAPLYALLAVMAVGFVLFAIYARPLGREIDTEYSCGEGFEPIISGQYHYGEATERSLILIAEGTALIVIAVMLLSPYLDMGAIT